MTFFKSLLKTINRLRSNLREKPDVKLDDYVLEHFLLYHGLVGSMPENQRDFKDVRADIIEAVNHASPAEMCIALKLPPLWWEDRLSKIFDQIVQANEEGGIECLLPEKLADDPDGDRFPLRHSDWRVRANAARMLAKLGVQRAVPYISKALSDNNPEQKPAFCHLAYSLARLQTEEARKCLIEHLDNEEPWFKVDAAGALAQWPLHAVAHDLMKSLLYDHALMDYCAVAIAKRHTPAVFLDMQDSDITEGAAEMICALLKGLSGPFHAESGLAEILEQCAEQTNITAGVTPTPRRLDAAISLNRWLHDRSARTQNGSPSATVYTLTDLSTDTHKTCVLNRLKTEPAYPHQLSELRHAIELTGSCNVREAIPLLAALLKKSSVYADRSMRSTGEPAESTGATPWLTAGMTAAASSAKRNLQLLVVIVDNLGKLGAVETAPAIIKLLETNLELTARWHAAPSKHPIVEQDEALALLYWTALQALGSMPCGETLTFLSQAVYDIAPDKREQALLSFEKVSRALSKNNEHSVALTEILRDRLSDPSAQVRSAALKAVGAHHSMELLPDSMKLIHSPEVSLQRQCIETLSELARAGHRDEVLNATKSALSRELDGARRERLNRLLRALQPT